MTDIGQLVAEAEAEVPIRWPELQGWLRKRFGREAGLEAVLFLVGVQSRGSGYTPQLDRDEKQELIIQGCYVVLSELGAYEPVQDPGSDDEWVRRVSIPEISPDQQEDLLKFGAIRYFEQFMDSP